MAPAQKKSPTRIHATLTLSSEAAMDSGQPLKAQVDIVLRPRVIDRALRIAHARGSELRAIINSDDDSLTKLTNIDKVLADNRAVMADDDDDDDDGCSLFSTDPYCILVNALVFQIVFGDGGDLLEGLLGVFLTF